METVLLIAVGAAVGANLRYWVSGWIAGQLGPTFPWGTFAINFSGSLGLALFLAWAGERAGLDPRLRFLVSIGFFGGYTTFSTFANESVALMRAGDWLGATANLLGTNLSCILGVVIGTALGSRL